MSGSTPRERLAQWSIWYVDWPHDDDGTSKDRPALVISLTEDNEKNDEAYFMKISTKLYATPHVFTLQKSDPAFAGTGLVADSHFYLVKIKKLPATAVRRRIGMLNHMTAMLLDIRLKLIGAKRRST
jgi:mRNA-degrading endonuclease toxin of MazEF toxin-antitoxin module